MVIRLQKTWGKQKRTKALKGGWYPGGHILLRARAPPLPPDTSSEWRGVLVLGCKFAPLTTRGSCGTNKSKNQHSYPEEWVNENEKQKQKK